MKGSGNHRIFTLTFAIAISVLYAIVRWNSLYGVEPILFPDSLGYIDQFKGVIPQSPFALARSWGYPSFLWLMGHDNSDVISVQKVLGIVSWLFLAWSVFSLSKNYLERFLSFISMLFVSLHFGLIQWDACVLTESLTLSLLAITVSLSIWIRLLGAQGHLLIVPLVVALLVLVGLRDANAFILPVFAGALLVGSLPHSNSALRQRRGISDWLRGLGPLIAAFVIILVAITHFHWATVANRGWMTASNAMTMRGFVKETPEETAVNKEVIELFKSKYGAPPAIEERVGKHIWEEPVDKELKEWLEENAAAVWKSFLLRNPQWVWRIYTFHPSPFSRPYEQYYQFAKLEWGENKPVVPQTVEVVVNSASIPLFSWWRFHLVLVTYLLFTIALWLNALWRNSSSLVIARFEVLVITGSIGAIIPFITLIGDAIEDWRHALVGLAAVYISLPIFAGYATDGLLFLVSRCARALKSDL